MLSCAVCASERPLIEDVKFRTLSTQDGLSQDSIFDLQFDDKGFLYIATENGLDRWDGYHLNRITGDNGELRETSVYALYYFGTKLLVGTAFKGVYIYDTKTGLIEKNIRQTLGGISGQNQYVNGFAQLDDDTILIVFDAVVLAYNTKTNERWPYYELSTEEYYEGHGLRWVMPFDETVLVGGTQGLHAVFADGKTVPISFLPETETDPDSYNVKHLYWDKRDQIWISTVQGQHVVPASRLRESVAKGIPLQTTELLPTLNIWRVTEDGDSTIWLGTDRGLYRVKQSDSKFSAQFMFEPKRGYEVLSKKDLLDVTVDAHGNLWMGTETSGALHWSPLSEYFTTLRNSISSAIYGERLTNNGIWALAESDPNQVWIGTENGLNLWDIETDETKGWLKQKKVIGYSDSYIENIFVQPDKSIIFATGDGFWRFDTESQTPRRLETESEDIAKVLNSYVFGAIQDAQGRLWFATDEHYFIFDKRTDTLKPIPLKDKINSAFFASFMGNSPELNNGMLMAASGSTWLIDPETLEATRIHTITTDDIALDVYPSGFLIDDAGILWIGYPGYGLVGLSTETFEQMYHFNRQTPLGTDIVYSLQLDDEGFIWLSSTKGLHRLNKSRDAFVHFTYGEPLPMAEFNLGADTKLKDGSLLFGSPSGVVYFDPSFINQKLRERESDHEQHLGMTITEFSSVNLPKSMPVSSLNDANIKLNHDDKGIKIRYSNMEFGRKSGQWFYYQLLKDNRIISEQDTQEASVDIPYLEPGNYTFRVYEKDSLSGESDNFAELQISVAYAPWTSPYALTGYGLAFFFTLAVFLQRRKRQLLALNTAKLESSMFGEAFQQTRDCVILLDSDKQAFAANTAFKALFGIRSEDDLASQWNALLARYSSLRDCIGEQLSQLESQALTSQELHLALDEDDVHDFLIKASVVDGARFGEESLYMVIFADISEQKSTERKLTELATHDTLTGLANRQLLMDRLEHAIKHSQQHSRQLAVMFIDLDRFKAINDSLGHDMGDILLVEISRRMRQHCPQDMTLARVGGDEFVAIAEDIDCYDSIIKFARQLIDLIEQPVIAGGDTLRVSCSVGAAIFPDDASSPDVLLRFADMAMYSAKKDPITPFCFYTRTMNEAAHERLQLENLVKAAQDKQSFYNVYQPIVNVSRGKTVGFELLMRCNIEGTFLSPAEFIPVLEQLRMIVDVTKVAVATAVSDLATWYKSGFNGYISVNLSAMHFTDDIDIDFFLQCLNKFGLPKSALRFEVTENVLMNDKTQALNQFNRLKDAGFQLALDDFGTGFSSLGYLRTFPLDVIKIDKSFCDGIEQSDRSNGLVKTTINMAESLSMGCIAEGVETEQQVQFLLGQGCHLHQGYHFSRPVKAEEAAALALKDWL